MIPNPKKGEWCFCEFKLQQIMEAEGQRITEVSDGHFRLSSSDLNDRCFPIDLRVKNISDYVAGKYEELHQKAKVNLNYPDINREFIRRWAEGCSLDDMALDKWYASFRDFVDRIWQQINKIKFAEVDGISLIR